MNTAQRGDVAEAQVIAALTTAGYSILRPFGNNSRYDLVIDLDGNFIRVQVKMARLRNGAVKAYPKSVDCVTKARKHYRGQVEYIGMYCPENNSSYLVPVDLCGTSSVSLRIGEGTICRKSTLIASDYLIKPDLLRRPLSSQVECFSD